MRGDKEACGVCLGKRQQGQKAAKGNGSGPKGGRRRQEMWNLLKHFWTEERVGGGVKERDVQSEGWDPSPSPAQNPSYCSLSYSYPSPPLPFLSPSHVSSSLMTGPLCVSAAYALLLLRSGRHALFSNCTRLVAPVLWELVCLSLPERDWPGLRPELPRGKYWHSDLSMFSFARREEPTHSFAFALSEIYPQRLSVWWKLRWCVKQWRLWSPVKSTSRDL